MLRKLSPFIRLIDTPAPEGGGEPTPEPEGTPEEPKDGVEEGVDNEGEDEPEGGWDQARALEKIRKANAEAKALRDRAKAAEGKAATADEALARAETAEKKLLRVTEAVKLGLPVELADRLQGDTPEEIAEDAEKLLALFSPGKTPAPTNRPKPNLRGGVLPGGEPEKDAKAIVEEALGR